MELQSKMAVVWETTKNNDHYQVRTAGRSVRLYKNRVFHSQWNETRPLSGGVWDLLFIPSLFVPPSAVSRVLILGVGGGAVIRQYLTFLPEVQIVGVELDPQHLQVARNHFGVRQPSVELICADAVEWVQSYTGPGFDIVIEDLFTEVDGEPERVKSASASWLTELNALLNPAGTLIINFEDPAQCRRGSEAYSEALAPGSFSNKGPAKKTVENTRFGLTLATYGNCVGVFLSSPGKPSSLRKNLDELLEDYPSSRRSGQQFRIRQLLPK